MDRSGLPLPHGDPVTRLRFFSLSHSPAYSVDVILLQKSGRKLVFRRRLRVGL